MFYLKPCKNSLHEKLQEEVWTGFIHGHRKAQALRRNNSHHPPSQLSHTQTCVCTHTHTPENRCKLKFNTRSTCTELHFQTTITKAQPCVFYVTDQELLFQLIDLGHLLPLKVVSSCQWLVQCQPLCQVTGARWGCLKEKQMAPQWSCSFFC